MAKAPGKRKAPAKSAPSKGKSKGAARPKPAKKRTAKPAAAPKSRGGYGVICSECYSDFEYDTKSSATQLTCPVCMHVGSTAERDQLARFQMAKGKEKSKFLSGLVPGILFVGTGLAWVYLLNAKGGGEELGAALNYGLLGATMILFLLTIFGAAKYESARHEVYF